MSLQGLESHWTLNPLFVRADRSGQLRDPLSENTQIDDLKLCCSHGVDNGHKRPFSVALDRSLSLAVQFLLKGLTCQSVIDLKTAAEGGGPSGDALHFIALHSSPPDGGHLGWGKNERKERENLQPFYTNHSLLPSTFNLLLFFMFRFYLSICLFNDRHFVFSGKRQKESPFKRFLSELQSPSQVLFIKTSHDIPSVM